MRYLKPLCSLLLTAVVFYGLHYPHGKLPALGPLFDPFTGFWQNNARCDRIPSRQILDGLHQPVVVLFDQRLVPHIFAQNDRDLYFAQGYITAQHRLWQMEMQTHAAAGRLAEILGRDYVDADRLMRRIGLTYATEQSLQEAAKLPVLQQIVDAYTAGVNAYIRSLEPKDYPLEYKLLQYAPEPWTPLKCMLLLKYMAWDLSGNNADKVMTQAAQCLDAATFNAFYPLHPPLTKPIIPADTPWPFAPPKAGAKTSRCDLSLITRLGFHNGDVPAMPIQMANDCSLPVDGGTDTNIYPKAQEQRARFGILEEATQSKGSNNWAVAGSKPRDGHAILCNDPHLTLQLPSVWYEVQLCSPQQNVYGVSLPGAPFVIIGFNDSLAWGVTNAYSDVLDWYAIHFQDDRYRHYLFEGSWRETQQRLEVMKVRGGNALTDTVIFTHHGPVVCLPHEKPLQGGVPVGAAMRWAGHDPSLEPYTFYLLNRAKNYIEFTEALSYYSCPAQNFVYADVAGNIAIWHNGRFPLRKQGQGRFIMDGSAAAEDWSAWVPREHLPHVLNPKQGFVASANQKPTDASYPYYLGWDYASFERGARIHELLQQAREVTLEDMAAMQLDDVSLFAAKLLPVALAPLPSADLSAQEKAALAELEKWDYRYRRDGLAPTIFTHWRETLIKAAFDDELTTAAGRLKSLRSEVALHLLLQQPQHPAIDNIRTPERETLADILRVSLQTALRQLEDKHGEMGESWQWGLSRGIDIQHLSRISALGRLGVITDGNSDCINAVGKRHGPSWRMTVALRRPIRALGIYPGGQSGHPGSRYYDTMVDDWAAGKAYPLLFLQSAEEGEGQLLGRTVLQSQRR